MLLLVLLLSRRLGVGRGRRAQYHLRVLVERGFQEYEPAGFQIDIFPVHGQEFFAWARSEDNPRGVIHYSSVHQADFLPCFAACEMKCRSLC